MRPYTWLWNSIFTMDYKFKSWFLTSRLKSCVNCRCTNFVCFICSDSACYFIIAFLFSCLLQITYKHIKLKKKQKKNHHSYRCKFMRFKQVLALAGSNILIICSWRYTATYANKYSVTEWPLHSFTHNR